MLRVGTDCSGIGSLEEALKRMGIPHELVFASEKDRFARHTYLANHSPKFMFDDMTQRDNKNPLLKADLYVAGIPCQPFSKIGLGEGEQDSKGRGTLFYNFYDYLLNHSPNVFILENVRGLLTNDSGRTFKKWMQLLSEKELGYDIHHKILNSKNYGIPQDRNRVFVVGIKRELNIHFQFPQPIELIKRLGDCLDAVVSPSYLLSKKMLDYFGRISEESKSLGNGFIFKPLEYSDIARTLQTRNSSRVTDNFIWDKTLNGYRGLTESECFRIMGFPDDFIKPCSKTQLFKQAGNSIVVDVLIAILKQIPIIT